MVARAGPKPAIRKAPRLHEHWERQWIIVCLGVISIATVALAAAFASAGLVNLAVKQQDTPDGYVTAVKFVLLFIEAATYLLLVARAKSAMFNTDAQLIASGSDRRRAVQRVYDILFWQLYFLVLLVAIVAVER